MHFIWGRQTTGHEAFTTKHVTVVNGPARKLVNQTINSQQSFYHVAAHLPLQRSGSHRNGLKLVQNLPKTAIVTVFQVFHHLAPADTGKMSSHLKRLPHPFKCALHVAYPEETERSIINRLCFYSKKGDASFWWKGVCHPSTRKFTTPALCQVASRALEDEIAIGWSMLKIDRLFGVVSLCHQTFLHKLALAPDVTSWKYSIWPPCWTQTKVSLHRC